MERSVLEAASKARRSGYSLIELLIVLGGIALVLALLLPAVQAARETARRLHCGNSLRQQGVALTLYSDLYQTYPMGWTTRGMGWTAALLPYLDQQNLFEQIQYPADGGGHWEAGHVNSAVIRHLVPTFRCPTMPVPEQVSSLGIKDRVPGSYRGNAGSEATSDDRSTLVVPGTRSLEDARQNGIFFACSRVRPVDVRDGLSGTWTVVESRTEPTFIKDGQSLDFWYIGSPQIDGCRCDGGSSGTEFSEFVGTSYPRLNARLHDPNLHGVLLELGFGSYHVGGAFALRADGSVAFVEDEIDLEVYRAFSTRDRGEVPSGPPTAISLPVSRFDRGRFWEEQRAESGSWRGRVDSRHSVPVRQARACRWKKSQRTSLA